MFKIKKNKKGFTLVELMVVVVIIGILVAIAIPVYNSVTNSAKEKTCVANLRTLVEASSMYLAKYGNYPTGLSQLDEFIEGDPTKIYCPSDTGEPKTSYTFTAGLNGAAPTIECPVADSGHNLGS